MSHVCIHRSGEGAEAFEVLSYHNGLSYAFNFGRGGAPSRTLFLQGDDARVIRDEFAEAERLDPFAFTRDIWLKIIDPYL